MHDIRNLKIRCAVCQRPIERVEMFYSPELQIHVLTAFCHGEKDDMKVRAQDMIEVPNFVDQLFSQEGVAFRNASNPRTRHGSRYR